MSEDSVLEAAQRKYPGYVVRIIETSNFLYGKIYTMDIPGWWQTSRIYAWEGEAGVIMWFETMAELVTFVGLSRETNRPMVVLARGLFLNGIAGAIALILTIAILILTFAGKAPPEVLTSAFTAAVGFYFGSYVAQKSQL